MLSEKRCDDLSEMLSKELKKFGVEPNHIYDLLPFITNAEADLCIHLRISAPLGKEYTSKIVELAKIRVLKSKALSSNLKSKSYTEGSVSKSETYLTAEDFANQEKELFASLATHRRCRIVK